MSFRSSVQRTGIGIGSIIAWVVGILLLAGLGTFLFATSKTDQAEIGIVYGGGPFEGRHFQQILPPGRGTTVTGLFDPMYTYPVTQRSYIISQTEGDVVGRITAPSKNNIPVYFEVATYFKLNTDKLREFHEDLGLKYQAWTDAGWNQLLAESFKQQIELGLQQESRLWLDSELYANREVFSTIQTNIGRSLKENVAQVLGDEYFCGVEFLPGQACPDFTFVIKSIDLPEATKAEYQKNRDSEIAVQTRENEVRQREAEARAIRELNAALEDAGENYVLLRAIEEGQIDFWVVPSDSSLSLQTPPRGD